jgi:hypothetical protein
MPYNTADSTPRPEISTLLMEAVGQEAGYIGQEIFPIYPSDTETGRYPIFPKKEAELLNAGRSPTSSTVFNSVTKRNETGTYNELDRKFTWGSYFTEEYGLEERVDDVVATRMANFFDAEMVTGKLLANALMLDYEMECAAALMNATTFSGNITAATATGWSTTPETAATASNIPAQVNTAIEAMTLRGERPDTLVLSLTNWNLWRRNTYLSTYIYGTLNTNAGGSAIVESNVAAAFRLKRVLVAEKSVNVALKGKDVSLASVWGNTYAALVKTGAGDFMNGGLGRTIVWSADSPGGLFTSESYRDEARRGSKLRVRSNRTNKILLTDACQLLKNVS